MGEIDIAGLEDFELVEAGGFGLVYRALQPRFERTVAVKVLQTRITDDKRQHQFRRECAAAGRLTGHPHIVTVFDAGFTPEGRPYIVMEWMDGGSLDDHLRTKGPLGPRAVVTIGTKMSGALGAAHDQGVLHRDVKPANILISRYGEPELADFGIASLGPATGLSLSTYALTPVHAAPEVLEGAQASPASDVYSLASTLWTLLAGEAPFAGPPDEAVVPMVMRILRSGPPVLERPDVPAALVEVLAGALAKAPADRPRTARAFGSALLAALDAPPAPKRRSERRAAPGSAEPPSREPADAEAGRGDTTEVVPRRQEPESRLSHATEVLERPGTEPPAVAGQDRSPAEPEDGGVPPPEPQGPSGAGPANPRRRRLLIPAIAAAVVLAAAGGAAFAFWPRGGDQVVTSTQPPSSWPPEVGDCLRDSDPAPDAYDPALTPCDVPHVSEVAATFLVSTKGTPYPGEAALRSGAVGSPCKAAVYDGYLGVPVSSRSDIVGTEIQPDEKSWANGRAMFICVLEHPDGSEFTGKLRGRADP